MQEEKNISATNDNLKKCSTSKLIFQTVYLTFISIILVCIIVITSMCFIVPKTMSNLSYKLGMEKFSSELAVYNYEKDNDINNLGYAIELSVYSGSHANIEKLTSILIDDEDFDEFAYFKDTLLKAELIENNQTYIASMSYRNYIYGNNIYSSTFSSGYSIEILNNAKKFLLLSEESYGLNNPLSMLAMAVIETNSFSDDVIDSIEKVFYEIETNNNSNEEDDYLKNACVDLYQLYNNKNDTENAKIWKEKYQTINI